MFTIVNTNSIRIDDKAFVKAFQIRSETLFDTTFRTSISAQVGITVPF